MPYTDDGKNMMLDELGGNVNAQGPITHLAAFDGDPTTTGTEITGGSPAYERQAVSFNAATGGAIDSIGTQTFDIPGGSTVDHIALMDAFTGGVVLAYDPITPFSPGTQATLEITDADLDLNL